MSNLSILNADVPESVVWGVIVKRCPAYAADAFLMFKTRSSHGNSKRERLLPSCIITARNDYLAKRGEVSHYHLDERFDTIKGECRDILDELSYTPPPQSAMGVIVRAHTISARAGAIAEHLSQGKTYREIARDMGVTTQVIVDDIEAIRELYR